MSPIGRRRRRLPSEAVVDNEPIPAGPIDDEEADALRAAIELRSAGPAADLPRPEFVEELRRRRPRRRGSARRRRSGRRRPTSRSPGPAGRDGTRGAAWEAPFWIPGDARFAAFRLGDTGGGYKLRPVRPAEASSRWGAAPRWRRRCGGPGDGPETAAPPAAGGRAPGRRTRTRCGGTDSRTVSPSRSA